MAKKRLFKKDFEIDIKLFMRHFIWLIIVLVIFQLVTSFFDGRTITLANQTYPLEYLLIIIFFVVFSPLIITVVRDTRKIFHNVSNYVVQSFPGMEEEISPILRIFRDIVYVIILFLISVPLFPLFGGIMIFGISVVSIESLLILVLLVFFIYDITNNIVKITKGKANEIGDAIMNVLSQFDKKKSKK